MFIMEPKTGLLIWWILPTILAMPYQGCNFKERIVYTKSQMEQILANFSSVNGNDINLLQEPISELDLKNLKNLKHKAQCGLDYMQRAVELIREHQSNLSSYANPIPGKIVEELKRTEHCVADIIGPCTNRAKKPVFTDTKIFERKVWGHNVLNNSVVFLDELKRFIAKKTTHG